MNSPVPPLSELRYAEIAKLAIQEVLAEQALQQNNVDVSVEIDHIARRLALRFAYYVTKKEEITYETKVVKERTRVLYPATWWQHVKQRFAPAWYCRRYPVCFTTIDVPTVCTQKVTQVTRICPHLKADAQRQHVAFLFSPEATLLTKVVQ